MGWIGPTNQMLWALQVAGADRDHDGRFMVAGGIFSFMGMGDESLVADDALYFVDGQKASLSGLLNSTSYGVRGVMVIA